MGLSQLGRHRWHAFALAAAIIVLDQATKLWALNALEPYRPVEVLPFFNLTLVFNPGAAFSFLSDADGWQRFFFIAVSLAISAFLVYWLMRGAAGKQGLTVALGLILGGAIGNVIDRIYLGHVVDFLDFHVAGWHWPAFNLADSTIVCGAGLLIWLTATGRD